MGKIKLIWPTVAEELQTSAERRRLQRDREQRTKARMAGTDRTSTTPDENSKPMELTDKGKTPKLKQQTLSRFFGTMTKNSAPTPVPPMGQQQWQNNTDLKQKQPRKRSSPGSLSTSSSSSIIAITSTSPTAVSDSISPPCRPLKTTVPTNSKATKLDNAEEMLARADNEQRRVQRFVNRLKKSFNELDRESLAKNLAFTTVRLDNDGVDKIQNPFLRYLVQMELAKKERETKMRGIPMAERKEFRRMFDETKMPKANPHFDQLLISFKSGKYEDSVVLEPEQFTKVVQLQPVFTTNQQQIGQHFGRALALTQFIHSHVDFLSGKNKHNKGIRRISAEKLLTSMAADGSMGYMENVLPVLRLFTTFLTDINKADLKSTALSEPDVQQVPVCSLRSRPIKRVVSPTMEQTEQNLLDVVKKLLTFTDILASDGTSSRNNVVTTPTKSRPLNSDNTNGFVGDGNNEKATKSDKFFDVRTQLDDLNICSFNQLSFHAQLTILEQFVEQIQSTDSFNIYIKNHCTEELAEVQQRKATLERDLAEVRTQLALLEKDMTVPNEKPVDLSLMSRKQSGEYNANLKKFTLGELMSFRILKINNKCRVEPLGQDRFHRFYWFFAGSADGYAVFVQQQQKCCPSYIDVKEIGTQCTSSKTDPKKRIKKEDKVDENDDELFIQRLTENVEGRSPCSTAERYCSTECWWCIQNIAQLDLLIDTLTSRGLREHRLKRQLNAYRDLIEEGMGKVEQ
ncbi:hypothetical protein niasHT_019946 [Heterodera trifolii]|uniref:WHIM2 domain-containing protein n=1 Tax=Heterodera trifolii TaxID=157864 RepID=A0ABD2L8S9_9BILA